jgi:hypothetical protein
MPFSSFNFILSLPLFVLTFWLLPKGLQKYWLILLSLIVYMAAGLPDFFLLQREAPHDFSHGGCQFGATSLVQVPDLPLQPSGRTSRVRIGDPAGDQLLHFSDDLLPGRDQAWTGLWEWIVLGILPLHLLFPPPSGGPYHAAPLISDLLPPDPYLLPIPPTHGTPNLPMGSFQEGMDRRSHRSEGR